MMKTIIPLTRTFVCVVMMLSLILLSSDPNNHNVIWVGTGENNHQRALGYGDGVYKSIDGGKSWKNMGLKESRQIGGLVIDPPNSDIVYCEYQYATTFFITVSFQSQLPGTRQSPSSLSESARSL